MVDRISRPVSGKRVLLFGPQALSFGEDSFNHIRSTISESEDFSWILDVIHELPEWLKRFSKDHPEFQADAGLKLLEDLKSWFQDDRGPVTLYRLPNILLNPLVIISQLTQYFTYSQLANATSADNSLCASGRNYQETVGFCTGLLSALAVSSSSEKAEFRKHGAAALRIGMLIGMVVDARDARENTGESVSLATVWNSVESGKEMARIMEGFPEVNKPTWPFIPLLGSNQVGRPTFLFIMTRTEPP